MKAKIKPFLWICGIWLCVWFISRADWNRMFATFREADLPFLAIALGLSYMQFLVSSMKWSVLLRYKHIHINIRELFKAYLAGSFISSFLPGRYGGDVYRGYVVTRNGGQGYDSAAAIVMERVSGLFTLVIIGLAAAGYWSLHFHDHKPALAIGLLLSGLLVFSLLLYSEHTFSFLMRIFEKIKLSFVVGPAWKFHHAMKGYHLHGALLAKVFVFSVLYYAHTCFIWHFSLLTVGIQAPLVYLALLTPVVAILEALPISASGLGLREGAFLFFFLRIGLPYEQILAFSAVVLLTKTVANLSGGLILLVQPFEKKGLKPAESQPARAA